MRPTNNSHAYVHMRGHCCHYNKQLSGCVNAARSPAWDEALFEKAATQNLIYQVSYQAFFDHTMEKALL